MSSSWMSIALSVLLLACVACQGSPPKDAPAKAKAQSQTSDKAAPPKAAKAPKTPANGCPLAIQKVRVEPKDGGDEKQAFIDAFNTGKEDLHNHSLVVRYTDKDGKPLKTEGGKDFRNWTLSVGCKANSACELWLGTAPAKAHTAEVKMVKVQKWEGEMPEKVWALDWEDISQWPQ